jgi:hypothetical protein
VVEVDIAEGTYRTAASSDGLDLVDQFVSTRKSIGTPYPECPVVQR